MTPTLDKGLDWLVPYLAGPEFGDEGERRKAVTQLYKHFVDYRVERAK